NKSLLKEILNKNITLSDYETLTDSTGKRLFGFGRYAGIVGCYNGFIAYGNKFKAYDLKPAHQCKDASEMNEELKKITLPSNFKIVMTGDGRVARGTREILERLNIKKVSPEEFLTTEFNEPVFTQLRSRHLFIPKGEQAWDRQHFYANPKEYHSDFKRYS